MERLIQVLKNNPKIHDYKVKKSLTHSYQLFYVSNHLEMNRISDASSIEVTIYTLTENNMIGTASFDYASYLSDEQLKDLVDEALFNASLALNPYFEIPGPQEEAIKLTSNLQSKDFKEIAEEIADTIFSVKVDEHCYSAATEIFLYKVESEIFNSKGLKNQECRYYGNVELIPTYEKDDKEVEIYHMLKFSDFDKEKIKAEVEEVLSLAKARFEAQDLPKDIQDIDVIIQDGEVGEIFKSYFAFDLLYDKKYRKMNLFELGDSVTDNKLKFDIKMTPFCRGSVESSSFDKDGISLREIEIIKDGKAIARHGSHAMGYYLNEKHPTGHLPIIEVSLGEVPFAQFKKKPYIRCVRFSGIQVDNTTGFVGGEVRLGYYFDGEKEIPVTGFTISNNMHQARGTLKLFKEEVTVDAYHGPKYLLIPNCKIA